MFWCWHLGCFWHPKMRQAEWAAANCREAKGVMGLRTHRWWSLQTSNFKKLSPLRYIPRLLCGGWVGGWGYLWEKHGLFRAKTPGRSCLKVSLILKQSKGLQCLHVPGCWVAGCCFDPHNVFEVFFSLSPHFQEDTNPFLRTRNLCPGRGDAAGKTRKRENAKTGGLNLWSHENTQTRKRENGKTRKRRKRENWACAQKHFEQECYHSFGHVWSMYRNSPFRSTFNTNVITALGMCKVCTEAIHSLALWPRTLSQLWAMCQVCTEAVHSVAHWTWTLSQGWTCANYVPKQSIAYHFEHERYHRFGHV